MGAVSSNVAVAGNSQLATMDQVISDIGRTYLAWALTDGIGPVLFSRLLIHFGDAQTALGASAGQLEQVHGIGRSTADAVARSRDAAAVEEEIQAAGEYGVRIVCRADPGYPPGLKQIPDAPIVLHMKGEYRETDAVALAIVGTRRCSIYASEQARRFGELLSGAGFTIVSGLARGVDAFAHHGAVDTGGRSIAVLGNGLTEIYPPENLALAEKLLQNGVWVSELPMKAAVRRENFPSRNRIIAGMTLGTLVIEAPQRSGALITARLASDYNREVFAIPGRLQEPAAEGTNVLIRDGIGKLVTCLEDILDELGEVGKKMRIEEGNEADVAAGLRTGRSRPAGTDSADPSRERDRVSSASDDQLPLPFGRGPDQQATGSPGDAHAADARPIPAMSAAEQRVYSVVQYDAILQDVVIRAAELPPGEVLAALTTLELKGLIKRLPGNLVVRRGTA
jgi:DNA processing protein